MWQLQRGLLLLACCLLGGSPALSVLLLLLAPPSLQLLGLLAEAQEAVQALEAQACWSCSLRL